MAKKKTSAKKNTEQLRKQAVAEIDVRLNGDAEEKAPATAEAIVGGKS